jgi:hypothetical protein
MKVVQCIYSPAKPVPYSFFTDIDLEPGDIVAVESGGKFNPFGVAIVQVYRTEGVPKGEALKAGKWVIQKITPRSE